MVRSGQKSNEASESPNHSRTVKKCFGGRVEQLSNADTKCIGKLYLKKAAVAARGDTRDTRLQLIFFSSNVCV